MASLQIRDMPDPLHQLLKLRARRHHRSLSQQALNDLQQAVADLQALARQENLAPFDPPPEELIQQNRSR